MSLSFLEAAREAPERAAVVTGDTVHTFRAFAPLVRGAIAELAALGIRPGDERPVAFEALPRIETLARIYALIETGVACVPLDERLAERERLAIVRACGAAAVLEGGPLREADSSAAEASLPVFDDGRPLAILHTSGTSGAPKGVVLSRRAFLASAVASAANLGWEEGDRWALSLPLARMGGFSIVTRSLLARRPVVLAGPFDAKRLARHVDALGVTLFSAVPAMIRRLLDLEPSWRPSSRLRAVLAGGGPIPARLLDEAWDRGLPVIPSYGLTETCSQIAAWPYGARPTAPVARPLRGAEIRVMDGRIHVRGPMLLTSYLPAAEGRSPFSEGGWFDTGDLGALDADGFLRVLGRADDMLVTGGENVSPLEIEREIESFPGVRTACVFGVEDETWGKIVAAAIVLESGRALDRNAFAAHLVGALAPHKHPRLVAILPSLPLGPGGKVDRRAVAREAEPVLEKLPSPQR